MLKWAMPARVISLEKPVRSRTPSPTCCMVTSPSSTRPSATRGCEGERGMRSCSTSCSTLAQSSRLPMGDCRLPHHHSSGEKQGRAGQKWRGPKASTPLDAVPGTGVVSTTAAEGVDSRRRRAPRRDTAENVGRGRSPSAVVVRKHCTTHDAPHSVHYDCPRRSTTCVPSGKCPTLVVSSRRGSRRRSRQAPPQSMCARRKGREGNIARTPSRGSARPQLDCGCPNPGAKVRGSRKVRR